MKKFVLTFRVEIPIEAESREDAQRLFWENKQVIVDSLTRSAVREIGSSDKIWKNIKLARK